MDFVNIYKYDFSLKLSVQYMNFKQDMEKSEGVWIESFPNSMGVWGKIELCRFYGGCQSVIIRVQTI